MTKKVETEKKFSFADIMAQYLSDENKEYMMTAEVEAGKETWIDLPDFIRNDHNMDLDDNSNNDTNVETKQLTCKKKTGHPEMIMA
eukprot:11617006-Ditylum_brightwellii.AAC.1